jgi:predicted translin family RNA/ssDNA-binding protein
VPVSREIVRRSDSALARVERAEAEAARAAALVERLELETLARAFRGDL